MDNKQEKVRYSDAELQEFKELILEKIEHEYLDRSFVAHRGCHVSFCRPFKPP